MILSTMRFDGYEWLHNPLSVEISHKRVLVCDLLPKVGRDTEDMGRDCMVVSGKGELYGKDCMEQYSQLEKKYLQGKTGVLTIPGLMPLRARFSRLTVLAADTPDLLTYSFEFVEEHSLPHEKTNTEYICREGDTLFDIAHSFGTTVDELVRLNPHLRRPDELTAGKAVRLC
ncbi:MAG: LysM peptidoglycan-binding domain-containing protein [Ruminococcus sp.]|nr:LysM peptidoglycan-binding domain-containing protein [Ruminococcus sp.]